MGDEDEELRAASADVQKGWKEAYDAAMKHAEALRGCGLEGGTADAGSLPRINALAQDCLTTLRSLQRRFDFLIQQFSSTEDKESSLKILEDWKTEYQILHTKLRESNLQAKINIQKAAKTERELLLGGGEESTKLRRNLETQAGMSAAAESVTESLRRTRQMMVQELERGSATLATLDESNTTLKKTDSEYKGQRYLLNTARGLLSVLKRHDVIDRIILAVGFLFFSAVVMFIFNERVGLLKIQRIASVSSGGPTKHLLTPIPSEEGKVIQSQTLQNIGERRDSTLFCEKGTEVCEHQHSHQIHPVSEVVEVDHSEL
ncbi:hypothetical protein KP509_17G077200 [Ceratopteris richardii]|uniref:Sec20 C-terminal domain-containing protein n=1 Tax=Ceratopteris richardii TaxID=49495 RepID=A0A8T2SVK4_CERRI|nr:hypothetical protein KP509_17G077200 [Ceratopteris richardii]